MKKDKIIGILSGMGPAAGLDLAQKILDQTVAATDQEHLPVALLSYPERIIDRSTFLFGQSDVNPADALAEIARQLEGAGAVVAGLPCNTAHAPSIFDEVARQLKETGHRLRLIHMIEETAQFIKEELPDLRRIGLTSTTAVYQLCLYASVLEAAGLEPVKLDLEKHERLVNDTIFDTTWGLKAKSNPPTPRARQNMLDAIAQLKSQGAEAVILGCTELPLAVPETEIDGVRLIDPTVVLARALIRETYPEKLRPIQDIAEPESR